MHLEHYKRKYEVGIKNFSSFSEKRAILEAEALDLADTNQVMQTFFAKDNNNKFTKICYGNLDTCKGTVISYLESHPEVDSVGVYTYCTNGHFYNVEAWGY